MLIAAGAALIALLFFGGGSGSVVDVWGKGDFRSVEQTIELVVEDEDREAEVIAALDELKKVEKSAGKELNKSYQKIFKLGNRPGTSRDEYDVLYTELDSIYEAQLPRMAEALVKMKSTMSKEEWNAFVAAR